MKTINRRVGLTYPPALPKWEGSLLRDEFGFSPVGGDGRGVERKRSRDITSARLLCDHCS